MTLLSCVERNPKSVATASVIWLHGLGADGHDFAPLVDQFNLPENHGIRFVFPHAPTMSVTLNGGMDMPAWFDLLGLGLDAPLDHKGINQTCAAIGELIEHEIALGVAPEKIILVGFSQGGAVALASAIQYPKRLAGVMGLSTYLPISAELDIELSAANRDVPIFMAHGSLDPLVQFSWGEASCQTLQKHGYSVSWHAYPIEHTVCMEEIQDISTWIQKTLALN